MRIAAFVLFAVITSVSAIAEDAGPGPREVAIDNLLSERGSDKAFGEVIAAARKSGVAAQAILEARFLYHVDRREDDAIAAMLPEFVAQRDLFKIEDSAIFSVKEDWLAVIEYVQAIASLKQGDKAAFKAHITEAFWLSPRQASAFAPHIDRMRLEETMRDVKIDFAARFTLLAGGEAVSLTSLMADRKAMILHFWSPASRECEASLPDYAITATALADKGIAMVSILTDPTPQLLTNSQAMIPRPAAGAWLADRKEKPLARELRVQTLPVFVLISNDGSVLFNGDPADDGLWNALQKINPSIVRPGAGAVGE